MSQPHIAIYDDGIHPQPALYRNLKGYNVHALDAHDILAGRLHGCHALIMPGGADLYYAEKLNGAGNTIIRNFVQQGGHFLGICAGAYYASKRCVWAADTNDMAIVGTRELGLLDVESHGPIIQFIDDHDPHKSWRYAARISAFNQDLYGLYNGGGLFVSDHPTYETLATYSEINEPAIITGHFGQGRVILSSLHFEITAHDFARKLYRHHNENYTRDEQVLTTLAPHQTAQQTLFKTILQRLLA